MPQPYLKPRSEIDIVRQNQGGFRDDNFNSGWTLSGTGASGSSDGDILTLTAGSGDGIYTKSVNSLSSSTWTTLSFRIVSVTGTNFQVVVQESGGLSDVKVTGLISQMTVFNVTLTAGRTVTGIQLQAFAGPPASTAKIDWVCVSKNTTLVFTTADVETGVAVTRQTTSVNEATFSLRNDSAKYMTGSQQIFLYDTVYCYEGYSQDILPSQGINLTKSFGGTINEIAPIISTSGDLVDVQCLGWAQALNNILIAQEYGSSSDNPSLTSYPAIITDIINTYVNATGTTYQLTTNYIQSLTGPPAPTYLLFKNDDAFSAIKQCCDLHTAGDPTATTVYPVEFFVDNSENCHLITIGSWGSDPNPSTYPNALNVGREEITNNFAKNLHDVKNKVHFITAYINPPNRDAFTEGAAASWTATITGSGGSTSGPSDDTGKVKVGSKSIKAGWSGRTGVQATLIYPSAANLGLDATKLGGKITPPSIRLYISTDTPNSGFGMFIYFYTNSTNYFGSISYPVGNDSTGKPSAYNDSTWHLIESVFGPYGDNYTSIGSPSWTNITQIGFQFVWFSPPSTANIWVDGLYFEGQNHYIATDSTSISNYGQRETHVSSLKHRDSSTEKKLAKAELYRLHKPVIRGSIQVPGIPDMLPGQLITVTAPSANLSSASLRVLTVKHSYTAAGFTTTLDLTDDVTNYQALQLTSMADILLMQYVPKRISQREKNETSGQPLTLSGMQDPTTVAQTQDYPS